MIFTVSTLTVQTQRNNSITSSFRLENRPGCDGAEIGRPRKIWTPH